MLKTNFQTDKRCLPRKSAFDIFASEEYMFPEGYQPENAVQRLEYKFKVNVFRSLREIITESFFSYGLNTRADYVFLLCVWPGEKEVVFKPIVINRENWAL